MQGVTKQMSFIFPVMIFVFSFLFPQGLAIYWATGTIFMVAQQYHLLGWNGLVVPSWFPGSKRVTALTIPAGHRSRPVRAPEDHRCGHICQEWVAQRHQAGERQRHQAGVADDGATSPIAERDGALAGATQQTE